MSEQRTTLKEHVLSVLQWRKRRIFQRLIQEAKQQESRHFHTVDGKVCGGWRYINTLSGKVMREFPKWDWPSLSSGHRICKACGDCQSFYIVPHAWCSTTFEDIMDDVRKTQENRKFVETHKGRQRESPSKALQYLKSQGVEEA